MPHTHVRSRARTHTERALTRARTNTHTHKEQSRQHSTGASLTHTNSEMTQQEIINTTSNAPCEICGKYIGKLKFFFFVCLFLQILWKYSLQISGHLFDKCIVADYFTLC